MGPEVLLRCTSYFSFSTLSSSIHANTESRLQALTLRFSNKIRRLTASDQVINKAGVVGWTQSVLVPELAMRLVKEDMNVSDDIARQIMRDSINIGELLNANPNDVVPVPRKEETT